MNEALGGRGAVYTLLDAVTHASSDDSLSLATLVADMRAGRVNSLLIIDSNPVYAAPGALNFVEALGRVDFSLCLSATPNETGAASLWAAPMIHPWEGWTDARAFDGTASVMQPQALPLFQGVEPHHVLGLLLRPDPPSALDLVRQTWKDRLGDERQRRVGRRAGSRRHPQQRQSGEQSAAARRGRARSTSRAVLSRDSPIVSPGSLSPRRPLCRQSMAPGIAAAAKQNKLGQSALDIAPARP